MLQPQQQHPLPDSLVIEVHEGHDRTLSLSQMATHAVRTSPAKELLEHERIGELVAVEAAQLQEHAPRHLPTAMEDIRQALRNRCDEVTGMTQIRDA